jgi:serine/threonine protein kinase
LQISDFGLSRVEDDDVSSSFPFNSCGTVAYVAPEALISNKKVTSSVDVSAVVHAVPLCLIKSENP